MSVTKISVGWDPWAPPGRPWLAHCPYCGTLGDHCVSWDGAMYDAEQHAADPCDGIRLALLLERLTALLGRLSLDAGQHEFKAALWRGALDGQDHYHNGALWACRTAADAVKALIQQATR